MKRCLLIPLLWLLAACTPSLLEPRDEGRLVVEGWIDAGEHPVVIVTSTVEATSQEKPVSELGKYVIYAADVTVEDSEGNKVQLTGRRDDRFLPPYIYTTDYLRGVPGRRYKLSVKYGNHAAQAETGIPEPVPLDRLDVRHAEADTLYFLTAYFPAPPSADVYYRFFTQVEGKDGYYLPSVLSSVDLASYEGSLPVMRGWSVYTALKRPQFYRGELVHVKLSAMERPMWAFWRSFDEVATLGTDPFFPVFWNVESNMIGGFGYWAGYGSSYADVTIQ